jgi:hypothetical protein
MTVNRDANAAKSSRESLIEAAAIPVGVLMLVVWIAGAFFLDAPGWIHALLTFGVFCVFWGIVARGTPEPKPRTQGDKK